jgi:fumarylacetoacetase
MAVKSWVSSANDRASDFPIQNLPYGVFRRGSTAHIGVAIGDRTLDLHSAAERGLLAGLRDDIVRACGSETLNELMSLGHVAWSALRQRLTELLDEDQPAGTTRIQTEAALVSMRDAAMQLPAQIGDYTDFYASIDHATRVGKLFRPDNPLLPNYKYIPIGYHGRASSIVISGHEIQRPWGQTKPATGAPELGPSRSLDYELEVGVFVGPGNRLGEHIPIANAEQHIFGLCLLNDWSARDIQSWEYQPLGPFLAKSFATSISPWVVSLDALAPHRVPSYKRPQADPAPLAYLSSPSSSCDGIELTLEVFLQSRKMRDAGTAPMRVSRGNLRDLYWSVAQLLTHHTSNGCNLRPGDLLATGTVSGPEQGSEGCLLEMRHREQPLRLPDGEPRTFLEDGDTVTLRACALQGSGPRIGFGECTGTVIAAQSRA